MRALSGSEVREAFLAFFEGKGHQRLPSASLIPAKDPTLLFTGAGMNQFKDMFLGRGTLPWRRVATAQKCLRVGDLDRVGRTPAHHTFFEMLGNFSFGDYFKAECVAWEWQFFTDVLGIPPERLVVTIYHDDEEAFAAWRDGVGIPSERIFRFGEKENFWPAEAPSKGPDGPCGPCSEIYYDYEPSTSLPGAVGLEALPSGRFVEIGNCVFTQFDRRPDGSLPALPQKNIDVGLGLERIVAVLQGVSSNFETDLFQPYIQELTRRTGRVYGANPSDDVRLRRVADHLRGLVFLLADGVLPANEGRGYVARKILRRAVRDGVQLGLDAPFLCEMAPLVGELMGAAYPEVLAGLEQIQRLLGKEEETFLQVYRQGRASLEALLGRLPAGQAVPCEEAFRLHDTHGFPFDTLLEECAERGAAVDEEGFRGLMEAQRTRSRQGSSLSGAVFDLSPEAELAAAAGAPTRFTGYERDRDVGRVLALHAGGRLVNEAGPGAEVLFVVDQSPFYAASGGQVGDSGLFQGEDGLAGAITDTLVSGAVHVHLGRLETGRLRVGSELLLEVDGARRRATERNHTATHLVHAALRQVLGSHVRQAGSLVDPERLRFDFTHPERLDREQLQAVELLVNRWIQRAVAVHARELTLEEARENGFQALFGEKYGDRVRGLTVGEFSRELCGGTHVRNSGALGSLVILSEGAVAAGVRRLEATTGEHALDWSRSRAELLESVASQLKVPVVGVAGRVTALLEELRTLRRQLDQARASATGDLLGEVEATRRQAGGIDLFGWRGSGLTEEALASLADRLRAQAPDSVAILTSVEQEGKVVLLCTVSGKALEQGLQAGKILGDLARKLGGGGGGKPAFARGRVRDATHLSEALTQSLDELTGALDRSEG